MILAILKCLMRLTDIKKIIDKLSIIIDMEINNNKIKIIIKYEVETLFIY